MLQVIRTTLIFVCVVAGCTVNASLSRSPSGDHAGYLMCPSKMARRIILQLDDSWARLRTLDALLNVQAVRLLVVATGRELLAGLTGRHPLRRLNHEEGPSPWSCVNKGSPLLLLSF